MLPLKLILLISGVALVLTGLGLMIKNAGAAWLNTLPDRLLNQKFREFCARPWKVERFIYRHHRLFGSAISLGALTLMGLLYSRHSRLLSLQSKPFGAGVQAAEWAMVIAAIAALLIGIAMFIRPSVLKGVEAVSNRWIELPMPGLRTMHPLGLLLTLLGLACLGATAWVAGA